ncbi:TipAS antibiotic-recognition domain-containing protein [Nocardia sp. NPDC101769]|uniref:MerR family transcriptional regulator n=1 Tax=Nocardia sp. NPDC101769 TaxID=3364333 RepID=UPI0037FD26CA
MGVNAQEWSIQDLAKAAGTTSRTLRHYGQLGLLVPNRTGANGMRYYDSGALVRLQRILLLRELGLGLAAIAEALAADGLDMATTVDALRVHLDLLRQERDRIDRQISSVATTVLKLEKGQPLMPAESFDGFDHTKYKDEVIQRWGKDAYESSDRWWRSKTDAQKQDFQKAALDIAADYGRAHAAGLAVDSPEVQAIVARHAEWVREGWQGRSWGGKPFEEAFAYLGEMYVSDDRFRASYDIHGVGTTEFARDAMAVYGRAHS